MNLNRIAYFSAVVDTGSFTRAAQQLGITKAVVSQQVAQLEAETGTSLLVRSTRRLEPTEAGRIFHKRCLVILREAEEAFAELAQARSEPTGTLKVTAPYDYGNAVVVSVVREFTARYPACVVELTLADDRLDIVADKLDLAIRVGWLADSSLHARRIGGFKQLLVCDSSLENQLARVREPADLASLPFVSNLALRDPLLWSFTRGDETCEVRMRAAIAINTTTAVFTAVRQGCGLSVLPDYLVAEDIAAGSLIPVLPEWQLPSGGIYAVYPAVRFRPPKVSAFVDLLVER
jgi:DNA-binding transcriptional LysR family regulator